MGIGHQTTYRIDNFFDRWDIVSLLVNILQNNNNNNNKSSQEYLLHSFRRSMKYEHFINLVFHYAIVNF